VAATKLNFAIDASSSVVPATGLVQRPIADRRDRAGPSTCEMEASAGSIQGLHGSG
jgi:hypothetical protein